MDDGYFYITEAVCSNTNYPIKLITKWGPCVNDGNIVEIIVLYNNKTMLVTNVCYDNVSVFANHLGISIPEYFEIMKCSFTCSIGPINDTFAFENGTLEWNKIFEDDLCMMYGKFTLSNNYSQTDILISFISWSLDTNKKLETDLRLAKFENEVFLRETEELKLHMEEMISTKNEMEKKLYSAFLILLNEKKRKNVELYEKLQEYGESARSASFNRSLYSNDDRDPTPGTSKDES